MQNRESKPQKGRAYWSGWVALFEKTPVTQSEFSNQHGLKLKTFQTWLYLLRSEQKDTPPSAQKPSFVEVVEAKPAQNGDAGCSLIVGSIELSFKNTPSTDYMASLVSKIDK